MAKSHLKLVAPTTENRTVATPLRRPNAELRTREYLTDAEVERADRGRQGQPLRPPRRHHDPGGLPSRPAGQRAGGPALGPDRLRHGRPARPPGQEGHTRALTRSWATNCGPAPAAAGAGAEVAVRVHVRARVAVHHGRLCPHGRARWRSRPSWASRPTRTCCATPAASPWPTRGTIRGRCRPTWATRTSSTRCATPSWRRIGSRTSGGDEVMLPLIQTETKRNRALSPSFWAVSREVSKPVISGVSPS